MLFPHLLVPLLGLLHINHVVDEELVSLVDLTYSSYSRNPSIARMLSISPLTVRAEAVVQFVGQCRAVVQGRLILK